jgi:hypothetical protein
MGKGEVLIWGLVIGAFVGFCSGVTVYSSIVRPPDPIVNLRPALDAVGEKCEKIAAERCMNITTPVVNVNVYDTPNLGRVKLAKGR